MYGLFHLEIYFHHILRCKFSIVWTYMVPLTNAHPYQLSVILQFGVAVFNTEV